MRRGLQHRHLLVGVTDTITASTSPGRNEPRFSMALRPKGSAASRALAMFREWTPTTSTAESNRLSAGRNEFRTRTPIR